MRVLVTRPEPEAARTGLCLAELGHSVLLAPLFSCEPLAADIGPEPIDAVLMTSPRTVAMMPAAIHSRLVGLPVFAVGDRTAEVLRAAGFSNVRSAAGDAEALGRLVAAAGLPRGALLLNPGGEARAGDLAGALGKAGLRLRTVALYRMVAVPELPAGAAAALRDGSLDAVLHYSPHAAATFARLVAAAGLAGPARAPRHVCLSAAVADALRPLAPARVGIAARPDEAALLAALDD